MPKFFLNATADQRRFLFFSGEDFVERADDEGLVNSSAAQFARDAESAEAAGVSPETGELEGEAAVIEEGDGLELFQDGLDVGSLLRAL